MLAYGAPSPPPPPLLPPVTTRLAVSDLTLPRPPLPPQLPPMRPECISAIKVPHAIRGHPSRCHRAGCKSPTCPGNTFVSEGGGRYHLHMEHHKVWRLKGA